MAKRGRPRKNSKPSRETKPRERESRREERNGREDRSERSDRGRGNYGGREKREYTQVSKLFESKFGRDKYHGKVQKDKLNDLIERLQQILEDKEAAQFYVDLNGKWGPYMSVTNADEYESKNRGGYTKSRGRDRGRDRDDKDNDRGRDKDWDQGEGSGDDDWNDK